jgi:hypothetical protein
MSDIGAITGQIETRSSADPKWRDRLLIAMVAFGGILTLIWTGMIAYGLGWLAWYLLH